MALRAEQAGLQGPTATGGALSLAATGSRKLSQSLSIEIPTTPTRRGAAPSGVPPGYPNLGSPVAMGIASYRAATRANSNSGRGLPIVGGDKSSTSGQAVADAINTAEGATTAAETGTAGAEVSSPGSSPQGVYYTIGQRLVEFDRCWAQYLDQFAAWKLQDASQLEEELVG